MTWELPWLERVLEEVRNLRRLECWRRTAFPNRLADTIKGRGPVTGGVMDQSAGVLEVASW